MTIEEAEKIIKNTNSPYLKRDLSRFIKRQKKKERKESGRKKQR